MDGLVGDLGGVLGVGAEQRRERQNGRVWNDGTASWAAGWTLDRVLDHWERSAVEEVIARIESHPADPRERLRELFELAMAFALSKEGAGVELAVRDWARRDAAVAARLRGVDDRRMAYMRSLFGAFCDDPLEVEARCLLAYSVFLGQHFVAASHGDFVRAEVLQRALDDLLR